MHVMNAIEGSTSLSKSNWRITSSFISLYDVQHVIFDDGSRAGRREVKSINTNYVNRDVF